MSEQPALAKEVAQRFREDFSNKQTENETCACAQRMEQAESDLSCVVCDSPLFRNPRLRAAASVPHQTSWVLKQASQVFEERVVHE